MTALPSAHARAGGVDGARRRGELPGLEEAYDLRQDLQLSVIGVQPKDRELLAEIAGHGGGLVYFVDDVNAVSGTVRAWLEATSGASSR